MNRPARILVVDDEPRYVTTIKTSLETDGYQVIVARDGREAIQAALRDAPDLIVMDVRMPFLDGYEASRKIRAALNVPILMLTAMAEVEDKVKGLETGADDYLTKPFSARELLARIRALLRRTRIDRPETPTVFESHGLQVDYQKQAVSVLGRAVALTPKEYCLLCELIGHPAEVLMPGFLLSKIWGPGYENERRLVWQTVHRLRVKIEPDPAHPQYIQTCNGVGYVFSPPKTERDEHE